jgi:hypothetical protein
MSTPATAPPTVPAIPDTGKLELSVVNVQEQYGSLVITTDADVVTAKAGLDTVAQLKGDPIITDLDKAVKASNDLHKSLISIRNRVMNPLDLVEKFLRSGLTAFIERREKEAEQRRLQIEAENKRKHEAEVKAALEAQKKALEEANPWEEAPASPPPPPAPLPPPVARVAMPVAGLSSRKLPPKAELEEWEEKGVHGAGFKKLVLAAAEKLKNNDDSLLQYLDFNQVAANEDARRWGKVVAEEKIPGITVVIAKTTVRR